MQTIFVISFFGGLILVSMILWALFLRIGLRWAKAPDVLMRRVVLATVLVTVLSFVLTVASWLVSPKTPGPALMFAIAQFAAAICVQALVIKCIFRITFARSLQAWLATLVAQAAAVAFVLLIVKPCVLEAFVTPTSAMAPTLLPRHWTGKCEYCGGPAYCTAVPGEFEPRRGAFAICERNFHTTRLTEYQRRPSEGDRFLVVKSLKPKRWDLAVFQNPANPASLYIMRLVGLPGEEITIRDGQVYANGKLLTPPESIRGIKYASDMFTPNGRRMWGTPDRPARLAGDEYFVLGDFSRWSRDSRLWDRGAPGHNPYAVPESHLRGVVTHIYWPLRRWRAFR